VVAFLLARLTAVILLIIIASWPLSAASGRSCADQIRKVIDGEWLLFLPVCCPSHLVCCCSCGPELAPYGQ